MEATKLTPIQQHLLTLFAFDNSEAHLLEMKELLVKHFSQQLDEKLDDLWDKGILDQARLDAINSMDLHSPS